MVVNAQEIFPPSVATGQERYPRDVASVCGRHGPAHMVDALAAALSLREVRAVNIVMAGRLHFCRFRSRYEEAMIAASFDDRRGQRAGVPRRRALLHPLTVNSMRYCFTGSVTRKSDSLALPRRTL